MPFREQPLNFVAGPDRYPAPDWEEIGMVSRVWVPDNETVGWIVLQGEERLAWLSNTGPDKLGYVIRERVDELMNEGAANKTPALDTWLEILRVTLHTTPTPEYLPAFLADVRAEWGAS
jgi:hypothetical protein